MIALESGIAPQALLDTDPAMLATLADVITERARKMK
jgi:hypothetical protein